MRTCSMVENANVNNLTWGAFYRYEFNDDRLAVYISNYKAELITNAIQGICMALIIPFVNHSSGSPVIYLREKHIVLFILMCLGNIN